MRFLGSLVLLEEFWHMYVVLRFPGVFSTGVSFPVYPILFFLLLSKEALPDYCCEKLRGAVLSGQKLAGQVSMEVESKDQIKGLEDYVECGGTAGSQSNVV